MANLTATGRSKHATLTANVVDVITLDKAYRQVEVINRDTTNPIYATIDRGGANTDTPTPTVAGDGTYYIGPGSVRLIHDDNPASLPAVSTVRLISVGAAPYSVTGLHAN